MAAARRVCQRAEEAERSATQSLATVDGAQRAARGRTARDGAAPPTAASQSLCASLAVYVDPGARAGRAVGEGSSPLRGDAAQLAALLSLDASSPGRDAALLAYLRQGVESVPTHTAHRAEGCESGGVCRAVLVPGCDLLGLGPRCGPYGRAAASVDAATAVAFLHYTRPRALQLPWPPLSRPRSIGAALRCSSPAAGAEPWRLCTCRGGISACGLLRRVRLAPGCGSIPTRWPAVLLLADGDDRGAPLSMLPSLFAAAAAERGGTWRNGSAQPLCWALAEVALQRQTGAHLALVGPRAPAGLHAHRPPHSLGAAAAAHARAVAHTADTLHLAFPRAGALAAADPHHGPWMLALVQALANATGAATLSLGWLPPPAAGARLWEPPQHAAADLAPAARQPGAGELRSDADRGWGMVDAWVRGRSSREVETVTLLPGPSGAPPLASPASGGAPVSRHPAVTDAAGPSAALDRDSGTLFVPGTGVPFPPRTLPPTHPLHALNTSNPRSWLDLASERAVLRAVTAARTAEEVACARTALRSALRAALRPREGGSVLLLLQRAETLGPRAASAVGEVLLRAPSAAVALLDAKLGRGSAAACPPEHSGGLGAWPRFWANASRPQGVVWDRTVGDLRRALPHAHSRRVTALSRDLVQCAAARAAAQCVRAAAPRFGSRRLAEGVAASLGASDAGVAAVALASGAVDVAMDVGDVSAPDVAALALALGVPTVSNTQAPRPTAAAAALILALGDPALAAALLGLGPAPIQRHGAGAEVGFAPVSPGAEHAARHIALLATNATLRKDTARRLREASPVDAWRRAGQRAGLVETLELIAGRAAHRQPARRPRARSRPRRSTSHRSIWGKSSSKGDGGSAQRPCACALGGEEAWRGAPPSRFLVVAHCKEPVEWLYHGPAADTPHLIYHKCGHEPEGASSGGGESAVAPWPVGKGWGTMCCVWGGGGVGAASVYA